MPTFNRSVTPTAMLALLLSTTSFSLPALAADPTPAPAPMTIEHTPGETPGKLHQHFDDRIKKLHDDLKLTKDQETQWDKVVQTMKDNHSVMSKMSKESHAKDAHVNAVDRLKEKQAITQTRADGMTKFITVFEPFYGSLSVDQKKTADEFYGKSPRDHREHAEDESRNKSEK